MLGDELDVEAVAKMESNTTPFVDLRKRALMAEFTRATLDAVGV